VSAGSDAVTLETLLQVEDATDAGHQPLVQVGDPDSVVLVGERLDRRPRVRIVVEPPVDAHTLLSEGDEQPAAILELLGVGDPGRGADGEALVPATDLRPATDQRDAEAALVGEDVADQGAVTGLEHVQRQGHVRQQHRAQREHRQFDHRDLLTSPQVRRRMLFGLALPWAGRPASGCRCGGSGSVIPHDHEHSRHRHHP
jgi:hypothetical protein